MAYFRKRGDKQWEARIRRKGYPNCAKTFDTNDFLENFGGKKPYEINQETLNKMMLEFFNDPMREIRERFDELPVGTFKVGGEPVKSKDQLKDMAKVMQEHLRKNHNPIELTGTIMYPEDQKSKP